MEQDEPISFVASGAVRCIGSTRLAHEPIEIVLPELTIAVCPRCGRRFRRGDPSGAVSPAAWPKDD